VLLARFPHVGRDIGSGYTRNESFLLPPAFQGRYRLYVRSDADNQVFENSLKANNVAQAATFLEVSPIPYADLAVSAVNADPTGGSGQALHISWTIANQGIGPTNSSGWDDHVQLARNADGSNIIADFGGFGHIGALSPVDGYT